MKLKQGISSGHRMKREERQRALMDMLVAQGSVELEDLVSRFGVSRMTVHRDLDNLASKGLLRKIRGGAMIEAGYRFESDFHFRERQGAQAKTMIAKAALGVIEPGMTIMLGDGSMIAMLGAHLRELRSLTVITNNLAVIEPLTSEPGIMLIGLGGTYSAKYNAFFGKLTEEALARLRADAAFISTPAIDGVDVFHMDDDVVRTKRAMIEASTRRYLLVNNARFGHTALHKLATLSEFDGVVTDRPPSADVRAALDRSGVRLILAEAAATENGA